MPKILRRIIPTEEQKTQRQIKELQELRKERIKYEGKAKLSSLKQKEVKRIREAKRTIGRGKTNLTWANVLGGFIPTERQYPRKRVRRVRRRRRRKSTRNDFPDIWY